MQAWIEMISEWFLTESPPLDRPSRALSMHETSKKQTPNVLVN
jgi:hypothetical protein